MYRWEILLICFFLLACDTRKPDTEVDADLFSMLKGQEGFLVETYSGILGEVQTGRNMPSSFLLRTGSTSVNIPALEYYQNDKFLIRKNFDLASVNQIVCGQVSESITPCLQTKSDALLSIFLKTQVYKILSPTTDSGVIAFYSSKDEALVLLTRDLSYVTLPYWKEKLKTGTKLDAQWYLVAI